MESVNKESTETAEDVKPVNLADPNVNHRAKVEASIQDVGMVLTMTCSCGLELLAGHGELDFQAIHQAACEHRQDVLEARMEEALEPLFRLFGML